MSNNDCHAFNFKVVGNVGSSNSCEQFDIVPTWFHVIDGCIHYQLGGGIQASNNNKVRRNSLNSLCKAIKSCSI